MHFPVYALCSIRNVLASGTCCPFKDNIRMSIILHRKKTSNEGFNELHSYSLGDKKFPAEVSGIGHFLIYVCQ